MGIPVICVVSKSGVGKTTFLEKLIKELKQRHLKVAVIKHDVHGFEIDIPGKDTWRHAQAGADVVAISSPAKLAFIEKREEEAPLDEVVSRITNVDIIFTEGYKRESKPKIEVFRSTVHSELLCEPSELLALVSDVTWNMGVPCFDLEDVAGVGDIVQLYMHQWNNSTK